MPGLLVHIGAITNCSHPPGTVTANPSTPPRVFVNLSQAVLTINDVHSVAGCPLQVPALTPSGTKPQPCVTIRVQAATKVFINGAPVAIFTPATLGYSVEQIPQGPPNASLIQKRVIAT
ncbi:hypothetical protein NIES4101_36400 [Calothrix sp. NIES-4101]|nr:hypothetical protein NIES4101_36400 [Calothrix sp. NIES-4101]